MKRAKYSDKKLVADILCKSFDDNKSVNYIIKQDKKRALRIKKLMEYSFSVCYLYGDVFLSDSRDACVLLLYPEKKKSTIKSLLLDIGLIFSSLGFFNLFKAMQREAVIKKVYPATAIYYLWFIGVEPSQQSKGVGSKLLDEVIDKAHSEKRTICLETSALKNIPWYERHGFTIYKELDFGYKLYCMMRL